MTSSGASAYGLGEKSISSGTGSMAIGHGVVASNTGSYVIGRGMSGSPLVNASSNTLMLGMNSTVPTMTITDAGGTSGAIGRVGIGTPTPDLILHVEANAVSGQDEGMARFAVSDNAEGRLNMANRTTTNSEFAPEITGISTLASFEGLFITGRIDPADDSGTTPAMTFDARRTGNADITVRPLFRWRNNTGSVMQMDVRANLGIGTTTPKNRLDVEGSLAVGATYSGTYTAPPDGAIIEGNVGIGTTTTSGKLHVNGTVFINSLGTPTFTSADHYVGINTSNNQLIDLGVSTIEFKEEVQDIEFDKEAFLNLRPVDYRWKEYHGGQNDVGLIAQEVAEVFPALATRGYKRSYFPNGDMERDSMGIPIVDSTQFEVRGVRYHKLPVYLLAVAKVQQQELNELRQQVQQLLEQVNGCCSAVQPMNRLEDSPTLTNNVKLDEFILLSNDPNPFSDFTDIKYEHEGCVSCDIIISDNSGRVLKRIRTNGSKGTARVYSSEIGSGMFLYSLVKDGRTVSTERMVSSNR